MIQNSLFSNIVSLWSFVGKKRLLQFMALFMLMLLAVFAEMVSLGAVVPFLSALTDPQMLMEKGWFRPIVHLLGVQSAGELLLPLTLAFIAAALISAGLRVLLLWVNSRMTASMAIQLRTALYRHALYSPYEFHLASNSSALITLVTQKIGLATNAGIMHVLMLVVALMTSVAIILTLLLIDPLVAMLTFGVLGGGYVLVGFVTRNMLKRNSQTAAQNQPLAVKQLQEGIGGIRDVILDQTQATFLKNYSGYVQKAEVAARKNGIISQLPKYVLELIGIVLIAGLAYYLQLQGKAALPILGALALGAQRLLPSLQQAYFSWSTIAGAQTAIAEVVDYLDVGSAQAIKTENGLPISFRKSIALEHVSFKYAGTGTNVLSNVSLSIPKGSRVGFIGETGSGKSTLLDVIMGLLTPGGGKMLIDGVEIDEDNRKSWQKHIAHVPQSIYLSDTTILENIAFGVPLEQIDRDRVVAAAKKAHLHYFIEELPKAYETFVGERGVQLSGGQRQRIGIARALYKQAEVIVFDEATSALDDETEKVVMQAIESLDEELTILMIAHRLSTLKDCDVIYKLSHGKIVEFGSYEQVCSKNTGEG
jgi:ATP-binding cassette, subfamily B, bacterial PglK